MTTLPDRQIQSQLRHRRWRSALRLMVVVLAGAMPSTTAHGSSPPSAPGTEDDILAVVPPEAKIAVVWNGGGRKAGKDPAFQALDAWTEFLFATIDETMVPVESSWRSASRIIDQLVPGRGLRVHACDVEGRLWIQVVRWKDPVAIERGLQRLGTKAMGRGRFRLPVAGIEVAVRENWLVLGPQGGAWIDSTLARLESRPGSTGGTKVGGAETSIGLLLRHDAPVAGASRLSLIPASPQRATIELEGEYAASPWPIRPATPITDRAVAALQGRFALVLQESGVGLLDPRLVEFARTFPEAIPPASIRRAFAPNRVVVLDGASVEVPGAGLVDVPAIAFAVPWREGVEDEGMSIDPARLEVSIDAWLGDGAATICAGWDPDFEGEVAITRQGEVRHLMLGPGFQDAMGGHPMASIGQLAWTFRIDPPQVRGWLVIGSSIGLVRRVADRLDVASRTREVGGEEARSIASHAVAMPGRIAGSVTDLSRLRRVGSDENASVDADVLRKLAELLAEFRRIEWIATTQDEHQVKARIHVRRIQETGEDPLITIDHELATTPTETP